MQNRRFILLSIEIGTEVEMLAAVLNLLPLTLPNLCRETNLDGGDTTSALAGIATDEVKTILPLAQFSIR